MAGLPDLLDQDQVWVDAQGNVHDLATMDRHHRANLIPFLRRSASTLQRIAEDRYWRSALAFVDDASDGVWGAQLDAEAQFEMPAEDWLERKPLMRRLVELEAGRSLGKRRMTALRNRAYELLTGYRKRRLVAR